MKLQQLLSLTRKAVDDFHMISDGDRIAVGVSGGKDSLTLLYALKELSRYYPAQFYVDAVSVDLGFENMDFSGISQFCKELDVPFHVIRTEIAPIVFEHRQEANPCSLCSKMRKGAFHSYAKELGCNKAAFGHHKDDAAQTLFMSLIFEGRLHTFSPVTYLDRSGITLIRPLLYVPEEDIKGFVNKYDIRILKNPCPVDGQTSRQYVKDLLKEINRHAPGVRDRIFTAAASLMENEER